MSRLCGLSRLGAATREELHFCLKNTAFFAGCDFSHLALKQFLPVLNLWPLLCVKLSENAKGC